MNLHQYNDHSYEGFQSCNEILAAIELLAGDDIRDEGSRAYRIWAEPSKTELAAVKAWAFGLTKDQELYWGDETLRRKIYTKDDLVLIRSDEGTGGWSLHLKDCEDEEGQPHSFILSGPSGLDSDDEFLRPNAEDYAEAIRQANTLP